MLRKLYAAVSVFALATVLALSGFCAYLLVSGRLTGQRLELVAGVLRGEFDEAAAPASAPETQPAVDASRPPPEATPTSRPAREHLRLLALERAKRDLEARQQLLDQTLQHLLSEREPPPQNPAVADKRPPRAAAVAAAPDDAGFRQEVEYVSGMQPRQAKEYVIHLWKKQPADAVRLLKSIEVSQGKRILAQFKTPEELELMSQLLEQLRLSDPEGYAAQSGKTGDATP